MHDEPGLLSRRSLILSGAAMVAAGAAASSANRLLGAPGRPHAPVAATASPQDQPNPALFRRALAALDRHRSVVPHGDRIAIVDFSAPSAQPRFHLLDVSSGKTATLLVAHGMGSDPGHTGFLQRFSNDPGSNASSEGAYLAGDYYVGKHGRSQRLVGLDPTNSNALERALVIHGAWYANPDMIATHGKLGRSQGCLAVGESDLDTVFAHLGEGGLIYAAKV